MANQLFFDQAIEVIQAIPVGRVTTYGHIARYIGTGQSARMVGWVLKNCSLLELPAHRVVNSSGLLTGKHAFPTITYMEEKLRGEGIEVNNDKVVRFKDLLWDPAAEL